MGQIRASGGKVAQTRPPVKDFAKVGQASPLSPEENGSLVGMSRGAVPAELWCILTPVGGGKQAVARRAGRLRS